MIIRLIMKSLFNFFYQIFIKEVPIPTYYGDEISYVNGLKYAFQVFLLNLKAKLQNYSIFTIESLISKKNSK